jgi:hypothetical protein
VPGDRDDLEVVVEVVAKVARTVAVRAVSALSAAWTNNGAAKRRATVSASGVASWLWLRYWRVSPPSASASARWGSSAAAP